MVPQVEGTETQGYAASAVSSCRSWLARISGCHQCWGSAHGTPKAWGYIHHINLFVIISRTALHLFHREPWGNLFVPFVRGVRYSGPQNSTEVNYPAICMGVFPA